jgi:CheY-like chemotaxis protein
MISAPVRVRQLDVTNDGPDEISMTLDVSRGGILFTTAQGTFEPGMEVAVTFPYSRSLVAVQAEQIGLVARVSDLGDGRRAVAVAFTPCKDPELVDSGGHKLGDKSTWTEYARAEGSAQPLVVVMDADAALRACLKAYLQNEGYDVIAVGTAREAREVLDLHTPALLIAEIEGQDLPGYELCAHVKTTPRLQAVPVMLMTRSAYPSDYANAHSLGAIVCMAKPYRQERLGHVVRLLAPPPHAKTSDASPRPVDPKRRHCGTGAKKASEHRVRLVR